MSYGPRRAQRIEGSQNGSLRLVKVSEQTCGKLREFVPHLSSVLSGLLRIYPKSSTFHNEVIFLSLFQKFVFSTVSSAQFSSDKVAMETTVLHERLCLKEERDFHIVALEKG